MNNTWSDFVIWVSNQDDVARTRQARRLEMVAPLVITGREARVAVMAATDWVGFDFDDAKERWVADLRERGIEAPPGTGFENETEVVCLWANEERKLRGVVEAASNLCLSRDWDMGSNDSYVKKLVEAITALGSKR